MSSLFVRKAKQVGLPPGTLVFTGEKPADPVTLSLIDYNPTTCDEKDDVPVEEYRTLTDPQTVTWINVNGVHEMGIIEALGTMAQLHPLVLEDIVHVHQRPKVEEFDGYLFLVLKMLHYEEGEALRAEQVSLVIGRNYVISFQEFAGDVFEPVRQRIRSGKGRIRHMGSDYLAYALLDTIVDHYFTVIEQVGEYIESLEDELLENPDDKILGRINRLRREAILLRKSVWPLREVLSTLLRSETTLFSKKTVVYLRDVYDHTIQVADMIETFRDFLSGLTDLYMSSLSHKMNEVMKLLTLIGTVFIPLTFVAGIYGMNFDVMPELHWRYGYPIAMGLMVLMGATLLIYFKQKRWL